MLLLVLIFFVYIIYKIVEFNRKMDKKSSSNPTSSTTEEYSKQTYDQMDDSEKEFLKERIKSRLEKTGIAEDKIQEIIDRLDSHDENTNIEFQPQNMTVDTLPDLKEIFPDYQEDTTEITKDTEFQKLFQISKARLNSESLLEQYVLEKIGDKKAIHSNNIKQIRIVRIILSVITFLNISYYCLYHEHMGICICIQILALALYRRAMKKMNLLNYVKKDIIARPDDNMDYIIESAKQNMVSRNKLFSAMIFPIALVMCFAIYLFPHIIYEKNDTGYSVRYYTYAILYDTIVTIPEEHKGLPVNEVRGSTFINMKKVKEVILPNSISEIRGNTFENSGLERIRIPEGVNRIGGHAFYGCYSLKEVILPNSIKEIGSSAFRRCSNLRSIQVPSGASINEKAFKESPTRIERVSNVE